MIGNTAPDSAPPAAVYLDTASADPHDGPALLEAAGFACRTAIARTPEEVVAAAEGATALLIGDSPVTAEVLRALPSVGVVSTVTVGVDHIDVAEASRRGVAVAHVPDAVTEEVAVTALAMALGLLRHVHVLDRDVHAGGWDPFATGPRRRVSTCTLGIVGYGRIGRRLAELASPLFGRVVACDPVARVGAPAEELDLPGVLAASDVVSLHAPSRRGLPPLLDAAAIATMRPGAFLVNVARGDLVDTAALVAALDDGHLGGAALDVLAEEPPAADAVVLTHPRVVVNPHAAFWSTDAEAEAYAHQARNVIAWRESGQPLTPVHPLPEEGR